MALTLVPDSSSRDIPGPKSKELMELRKKYLPESVSNATPLFAAEAKGAIITDVDGNEFIDFAGGIGVLNVGSCPIEVVNAIKDQVERLIHTSSVMLHEPYVRVAEKLCTITPGDTPKKAFLVNSGAEAVENAVKIARKYTGRRGVIALENSFHGRTMLTSTLTSKAKPYKVGFGPLATDIYRVPSPYCYRCSFGQTYPGCTLECAKALKKILDTEVAPEDVAAIILEPIQGEGGFIVLPNEYLRYVKELCEEHGFVLIADEIQSGWGRSGKLFAIEYSGIEPDILTTAKSIAAGLPLSAVVAKADVIDSVHKGGIGSTYSGNPVACAAALKVMEMMEKYNLPQRANHLGEILFNRLSVIKEKYPFIGDVRGRGAMYAVEFVKDKAAKEPVTNEISKIMELCLQRGLIVIKAGTYNNVIRFLPPLVIKDEQLVKGLDIFEESIALVFNA